MDTYSELTKEELLSDVEKRKAKGSPNFSEITTANKKDDIIAALMLDDEHLKSKAGSTPEFKSSGAAVAIPKVTAPNTAFNVISPDAPGDETFKELVSRDSDGMEFALSVHEPDTYGRTHTCKNDKYTWEGTREQFRSLFNKTSKR